MRTVCGVVLPLLKPPRGPIPARHKVPRDREVKAVAVPLLLSTATVEVKSRAGEPTAAQVNQPQHTKATRPKAQHRSPLRVPGIIQLLDLPLQKRQHRRSRSRLAGFTLWLVPTVLSAVGMLRGRSFCVGAPLRQYCFDQLGSAAVLLRSYVVC